MSSRLSISSGAAILSNIFNLNAKIHKINRQQKNFHSEMTFMNMFFEIIKRFCAL